MAETAAPKTRKPRDPNAPRKPRAPKPTFGLLGVDEGGKPYIHAITQDAMTVLKAIQANPNLTLVENVEVSK